MSGVIAKALRTKQSRSIPIQYDRIASLAQAEWVRLQEHKGKHQSRQFGAKPQGGRPAGGIRAASRDLGIPASTIRRAVRIASLSPEAKEAAIRLKWKEIQAVELPQTDETMNNDKIADLAEIAENLHRREITALERAELQARWVEIVGRRDVPVSARTSRTKAPGKGRGSVGGVRQAARDLGVPETNLRQSVRIATLSDDAKEAAKASGLDDNQSALLKAAKAKKPVEASGLNNNQFQPLPCAAHNVAGYSLDRGLVTASLGRTRAASIL